MSQRRDRSAGQRSGTAAGDPGRLPVDDPPGGGPPCAICAGTGQEPRQLVHFTHGVAVWLCEAHAEERYLREDDGRVFADRLAEMWIATGTLTVRRAAALQAHVRQICCAGAARGKPGSYSWPQLRREAERRFAAGHDPRQVIQELRDRHIDCPAMAPSPRTMRRWYTQARWLIPLPPSPRQARKARRRPIPAAFCLVPYALTQYLHWGYLDPRWRGG